MSMQVKVPRMLTMMLLVASTAVFAQGRTDLGKREYDSSCANCHGMDGKGSGTYIEFLKRTPSDLTTLTKRNSGVFPVTRIYEVIEAAGMSHGSRDMPIWGNAYRVKAAEYYADMPYNPEVFVRTRILSLVEYLSRLQAK